VPTAYLSKPSLATELDVAESTVDEMVRRGVLPRPVKLSAGCVRWRWADVDMALASLGAARNDPVIDESAAGVRLVLEASKKHRRGAAS
jgi:predicted DNA-binding transcriptional regulator AlpA